MQLEETFYNLMTESWFDDRDSGIPLNLKEKYIKGNDVLVTIFRTMNVNLYA